MQIKVLILLVLCPENSWQSHGILGPNTSVDISNDLYFNGFMRWREKSPHFCFFGDDISV